MGCDGPSDMSVFCSTPRLTCNMDQAVSHAQKSMIISGKPEHLVLILGFDDAQQLNNVDWQFISKAALSKDKLAELERDAITIKRKRLQDELLRRDRQKIGRNEPCPCGSRLKYKKCCARLDE